MYPQKVLQGIPDLKRAVEFCILDFLVVIEGQLQFVRHGLLGKTGGLAGGLQVLAHRVPPFLPPSAACAIMAAEGGVYHMGKSLKKHLIESFAKAANINGIDQNQVILTTAIGLISGKLASVSPITADELLEEKGNISQDKTAKLYEMFLTSVNETYEDEVEGNDGYILLTDVSIRTQNNTINLGTHVVFFDQIIGISIGQIN